MPKIQELPVLERPREKLLRYGIDKLSDEELLAIVIGSGCKGKNAKEIASEILSSCHGLSGLSSLTYKSLLSFKGISKAKAIVICVIIEFSYRNLLNSADALNPVVDEKYLFQRYSYLKDINQEQVIVICLDIHKKIVHEETLYKGNENSANTSIKEIIRVLLDYNSRSFYLIHNHPSGKASPSADDILLTENLMLKAKNLGIHLIDHLIFGKDNYYSFKKHGGR